MDGISSVSTATFNQLNNDENLPLEGLVMIVLTERANLLDAKVRDQLIEVKDKNDKMANLNGMMGQLRNDLSEIESTDEDAKGTMSPEVEAFLAENFPDFDVSADGKYTRATMNLQLENLKGKADSVSSLAQLEMIQLQSGMGHVEQNFEQMSNQLSKIQGTTNSIVRNLS